MKSERKSIRVINEKSVKFHDILWIAVLSVQYTALGRGVMPSLHQTATLTLMSVLVWNVEPLIVLACQGMIGDHSRKAGIESIVIIDML